MGDLNHMRNKCHMCVDNFMNRSDLSDEYKRKRVGAAINYMKSARDVYGREDNGYHGKYIKDNLGRCHAESNEDGYVRGEFVPCPAKKAGQFSSRERVGAKYGSRERFGSRERVGAYKGPMIKDSLGRCHASRTEDGYRAGEFVPCSNNVGGSY